jgi:hypothetical protein
LRLAETTEPSSVDPRFAQYTDVVSTAMANGCDCALASFVGTHFPAAHVAPPHNAQSCPDAPQLCGALSKFDPPESIRATT